jgi:predicted Zn-dependent peptidase
MSDCRFACVHHRLPNGLRVVVSPDRVAPVVAMNLWYDVGSRHERPGRTGFAHLFEHLMFEGSTSVGSGEHMRVVQDGGGDVNATTSSERTAYVQTVPVEQLELMLYLEADRMAGLLDGVTQHCLDKQREVVKNERRQRFDNQPYGTAYEHLASLLYPAGHPYHHLPIGSMEDLGAASLDDVHDFFRTYYAPDNAVLSLVGHVDPDEAIDLVAKHMGHVPPGRGLPAAPAGEIAAPLPTTARLALRERVPASAVYLGFRLPPDDDPVLDAVHVATSILTNGRSSVLHRRLVQGELAQMVTASVSRRVAGASECTIVAVGRQGSAPAALEGVIREELERLAQDGPSEVELHRAKAMVERTELDRLSGLEGRAEALSRCAVLYGDPGRVNTLVDRLRAPTADDVRAAVGELLVRQPGAVIEYEPIGQEAAA